MTTWADLLATACEDVADGTPGAVLGVWHGGRETVVPHGVLHRATGAPVLEHSVFQIGSVSKPWTAALIAQLADEGSLTLDTTVAELLPGIRLGDDDRADRVTVRHLLTHTSGIDGDVFTDTGRGDDAVARYVDELADAVTSHEPGAAYSYCNSGFVVLGRIVEVLLGGTWDHAIQRRIAAPLGLAEVCTLPDEAILRSAAVGHEKGVPVTQWALPRSVGPAGTITTSAHDLLGFARHWLGEAVPAWSAAMGEPLVPVPDGSELSSVGWGWRVGTWGDGVRVLGHNGLTLGQSATLRVVPELDLAVCLLTNSEHADAIHHAVVPTVVQELTGIQTPPLPAPIAASDALTGLERHVGTYSRRAARYDVELVEGSLRLTATPTGELASHDGGPDEFVLHPRDHSGDAFVRRGSDTEPWSTLTFGSLPDGTPHLFVQGRIAVRA